jgi:hypothetical protein
MTTPATTTLTRTLQIEFLFLDLTPAHGVARPTLESACDSCSETCACNGAVDCRDWLWRDERSHEPPLGLIVEAIMRHAGGADPNSRPASPPTSATFPANLRQYFAATGRPGGRCSNGLAGAACGCQA